MNTSDQIQREKELVAAWLNYRMGDWLRSATYVSNAKNDGDMAPEPNCLSKQSIERYASDCIYQLSRVAHGIDWYQPVAEISHDGHVTITVR